MYHNTYADASKEFILPSKSVEYHEGKSTIAHSVKKSYHALIIFLLSTLVVLVATVFFIFSGTIAHAQEGEAQGESVPASVIADSTISAQDLHIKEPSILPGSPLYGVKNFFRGVQKTFTFNPVKKTQLEIRYANERAYEAKKLIDTTIASNANERARQEAFERAQHILSTYQKDIDNVLTNVEQFEDEAEKEVLLDTITDNVLKHDRIIEHMQQQGLIKNNAQFQKKAREHLVRALKAHTAESETLAQKIDTIITRQEGSDFKHFKALEVWSSIEHEFLHEDKERIEKIKEQTRRRFEEHMNQLPDDIRIQEFQRYVEHVPGNSIEHVRIIDELKSQGNIPPDMLRKLEDIKTNAAKKFAKQIEQAPEHIREELLRPLRDGDAFEVIRLTKDLEERIPEELLSPEVREKIFEHQKNSIQKFKHAFTGDENAQLIATRADELFKKVRNNPDPQTFRALEELEKELTPEQKVFVERMREEGAQEIERRMREEGELFFERIKTYNPRDIEIFNTLHTYRLPSGVVARENSFEQLKALHIQSIADRLQHIAEPQEFERFKQQFNNPVLRAQYNQHALDDGTRFDTLLSSQEIEVHLREQEFEERLRMLQKRNGEGTSINLQEIEQMKQEFFNGKPLFPKGYFRNEDDILPFKERSEDINSGLRYSGDSNEKRLPPDRAYNGEPLNDVQNKNTPASQPNDRIPPSFIETQHNIPSSKASAEQYDTRRTFEPEPVQQQFEDNMFHRPQNEPNVLEPLNSDTSGPQPPDSFQKKPLSQPDALFYEQNTRVPQEHAPLLVPENKFHGGEFRPQVLGAVAPHGVTHDGGRNILARRVPEPLPDTRSRTFPIDIVTGFIKLITFAY